MTGSSALSRSLIGYAPLVDRKRNAMATRVTIRPHAGVSGVSYGRLYAELSAACPQDMPPLLLSVDGHAPAEDLLAREPLTGIWVELPGEGLDQPGQRDLARELHRRGFRLVLSGRPAATLPPDLIAAFSLSLIDVDTDRRLQAPAVPAPPPGVKRSIPYAQVGVGSIELMERCFATGAFAIVGWPFQDALRHASGMDSNPDFVTIAQLVQMIDRGEDPNQMEHLIRRDPALAYRLLRYINSPGFGLRVEVQSFRHAVMMLGVKRLRRWLMLMAVTSSKDANMRPLMFASFRRGLFLENLIGDPQDQALRDEVFILGVFSLLDRLFSEPFEQLLSVLQVPERVQETLVSRRGAYAQYLAIAEAVEQGPTEALPDLLSSAVLSVDQCNASVVRALVTPDLVAA